MEFELQPILKGDLLELRPLQKSDFDALYEVAADPLIWEQHPVARYRPTEFRSFFDDSIQSGGSLVAYDVTSQALIGSSRFHGYNVKASEIEIGWSFLARAYWGGDYNREMKRLMLDHAFQFVDSVVFLVGPDNFRSQRAMEKIGGIREGTRLNAMGFESVVFRISSPRNSSLESPGKSKELRDTFRPGSES